MTTEKIENTGNELIKSSAESERDSNIEAICRAYAFVEFRDAPYDSSLFELKKRIEGSYNNSLSSYEEGKKRLKNITQELEEMHCSNKGFLHYLRIGRMYRDRKSLEEISELGESFVKNKDKIREIQRIAEEAYNKNAKVILEVSSGVREAEGILERAEEESDKLEKMILRYHELNQDPGELKNHVTELIEERIKKGDLKEIASDDKKSQYVEGVIKKGKEELQRLCENYLKIRNDIPIARSILSYKSLVDKFNQISDSFSEVRNSIMEDISHAGEVIRLYEVITKKELDFLQDIKLPEKYGEAIGNLVSEMERVDGEFSKKVLDAFFSEKTRIAKPDFDNIVPGLVKHLNGNGDGDGKGNEK